MKFIPQNYREVLQRLDARLTPQSIIWALTGSVGLILRGVEVGRPGDIDIQTDRAGSYAIERLFDGYVRRPVAFSTTDWICSHFGALTVAGIVVEIMGDVQHHLPDGRWSEPADIRANREWVELDGLRLPLLSLAYEAEAYRRLGRPETAARIREVWQQRGRP